MTLQEQLELLAGVRLQMRINRNRVSVLRKVQVGRKEWKLSIHEAFVTAPLEVVVAVAAWLAGREEAPHTRILRRFIHAIDVKAPPVKVGELVTRGRYHDLQEIYDGVNREYFGGEIDLAITWFQANGRRRPRRITLGQYCDVRQLIRVSSRLDQRKVPEKVVAFVVYHEMVHHVEPPLVDRAGRQRIHHRAFKLRERAFREFEEVQAWEKSHGWT